MSNEMRNPFFSRLATQHVTERLAPVAPRETFPVRELPADLSPLGRRAPSWLVCPDLSDRTPAQRAAVWEFEALLLNARLAS